MIKGAQKQMIVVRTGDSRYFDEAYFVLKREVRAEKKDRNDLLREADRILSEQKFGSRKKRRGRWIAAGLFLSGLLCGGGLTALLAVLANAF